MKKLHEVPPQITRLYNRGVKSVIPLFQGKNPGYAGWQKITDEEAQENIWSWGREDGKGVNYGIRLGSQFGCICDIDLDSVEARQLAKYYLPDTLKFGRGGVVTHWLYKVNSGGEERKLSSKRFQWDKREEKTVVLELRYSGQTMGPGSVHPDTGELVEWMSGDMDVMREVDCGELVSAVEQLAAASMLLRDWQSGGRDELAVCLVGSMVRGDWEPDDVDRFLYGILIEAGDEEGVKRLKAERLLGGLSSGELRGSGGARVPGLRRLREVCSGGGLGRAGFEKIVEWLGLGGGDILEEMNAEFAVVKVGGSGVGILREAGGSVDILDRRSFSLLCANREVDLGGGKRVTADKFWLGHRDRREYLGGVVFKPEWRGGEEVEGEYNMWRGFACGEIEPMPGEEFGGGWECFLGHLRVEVCAGRSDLLEYLLGWMAHRVQRPWEPAGSAVVLVGTPRNGKSSVFKIFGRLFGRGYMTVTNIEHISGKFNAHLMDKVLVLADEVTWGGDKQREGVLKTLITEPRRTVEMKGRDSFEVDNCLGVGICSNNEWVVPVGRGDKRYLVMRVGDGRVGDRGYWDALYDEMREGGRGLGRMLWDLKRRSLSGWDAGVIPETAERAEQRELGAGGPVQYVLEWGDEVGDEIGSIGLNELHAGYMRWCERHKFRSVVRLHFKREVERVLGECVRVWKIEGGERVGKEAVFRLGAGWRERMRDGLRG